MPSFVVGALRVILGLDTAAFEKGAKDASSQLSVLAGSLKSFAKGFLGTLSVGAIGAAFQGIVNHIDEMGKSAQRLGLPVELLSQLKYAADIADVSFDQLSTSVSRFSRTVMQVASGAQNDASRAFAAMGISIRDSNGQIKNAQQLLFEIADVFQKMPDGIQKTALSIALFNRSGQMMIPLLNEGSAGLRRLMQEGARFGVTVTQQMAKAADQFNDNLDRLRFSLQAIAIQGIARLLPLLNTFGNRLVGLAQAGTVANRWGSLFADLMEEVARTVAKTSTEIKILALGFAMVKKNLTTLWDGKDAERYQQFLAESTRLQNELTSSLKSFHQARVRSGSGGSFGTSIVKPPTGEGVLDEEALVKPIRSATNSWGDYREVSGKALTETKTLAEDLKGTMESMSSTIADGLTDIVMGTSSVKDAFQSMAQSILRELTNLMISHVIQQFIGLLGGIGGSAAPGVGPGGMGFLHFGGPRAAGGSVSRGKSYLVGERGPELFTPNRSGMIAPGGGGATVNIIDQRTTAAPAIQSRTTSDGSQEFIVRDTIRKHLPGELSRLMPVQFGAQPRLSRRGS